MCLKFSQDKWSVEIRVSGSKACDHEDADMMFVMLMLQQNHYGRRDGVEVVLLTENVCVFIQIYTRAALLCLEMKIFDS